MRYPKHLNLLALDMATTTGWAQLVAGEVTAGRFKVVRRKGRTTLPDDHDGIEFLQFQRWVNVRLKEATFDLIVYEEPASFRNITSTAKPYGFRGCLMAVAAMHRIPVYPVNNQRLKKAATGSGKAEKVHMLRLARQRHPGLSVEDDNVADALHLLAYGLSARYGIETLQPFNA